MSGGELLGAFAIGVLAEIEKRLERPLTDYFDLIAGTSTGSISAAALCVRKVSRIRPRISREAQ